MATFTKTIAWTNGSPRFNPPAGVTPLQAGDSVIVRLSGAPQNAQIDWVKIFPNQVVNGQDQKNVTILTCYWARSGPGEACSQYSIAAQSATQVTITDQEHPQADDKYWFSVGGSPGSWQVDPELINKPDSGGGG